MTHILDNPIWNALITGNKGFAYGSEGAKYMERDIGIFAGLKANSQKNLDELRSLVPEKSLVVLFTPEEIALTTGWNIKLKKVLLQMVYQQQDLPVADNNELITLQDKHVPAMLELTAMTNPGPFLSRTIELGNYEGIFHGSNLIAMAGQRLQPEPYTEISAVCTRPDYTGKGYAAKLVRSQISKIRAVGYIPFLHVYPDNTAACKLYEKLGFHTRKEMIVYVLEKEI